MDRDTRSFHLFDEVQHSCGFGVQFLVAVVVEEEDCIRVFIVGPLKYLSEVRVRLPKMRVPVIVYDFTTAIEYLIYHIPVANLSLEPPYHERNILEQHILDLYIRVVPTSQPTWCRLGIN